MHYQLPLTDVVLHHCRSAPSAAQDAEFGDEFLSERDPSILHFLVASGDEISSKQLRDDLMTMLIAGHETTAAVLTWTMYLLAQNPQYAQEVRDEVDAVIGDRSPGEIEICRRRRRRRRARP